MVRCRAHQPLIEYEEKDYSKKKLMGKKERRNRRITGRPTTATSTIKGGNRLPKMQNLRGRSPFSFAVPTHDESAMDGARWSQNHPSTKSKGTHKKKKNKRGGGKTSSPDTARSGPAGGPRVFLTRGGKRVHIMVP